jgi:phosphopantetheinyl transferase
MIPEGTIHIWWHALPKSSGTNSQLLLSAVLAHYLDGEPRILRDRAGKPRLPDGTGITFNLSHSGERQVVAVAGGAEVGVDIERWRGLRQPEIFAKRCCTPTELEALNALDESQRNAQLLQLWTIKEAYLKALGTGIRGPLRNVASTPDGIGWALSAPAAGSGSVRRLQAPSGYVGSVCLLGGIHQVRVIDSKP